jgi:hypothetical protein
LEPPEIHFLGTTGKVQRPRARLASPTFFHIAFLGRIAAALDHPVRGDLDVMQYEFYRHDNLLYAIKIEFWEGWGLPALPVR